MALGSILGFGGGAKNTPVSRPGKQSFNKYQKIGGYKLRKTLHNALAKASSSSRIGSKQKLKEALGEGYAGKLAGKSFTEIASKLKKLGVSESIRKGFEKEVKKSSTISQSKPKQQKKIKKLLRI